MLSHSANRVLDSAFLRVSGGDAIRADELRARATGSFMAFIMASYIPLGLGVGYLLLNRPQPVNTTAVVDQMDAVKDYATRYVDTYLKDPSNSDAIKKFYEGEIPPSALPAGGRALHASSALPGSVTDGFRTYSVIVESEIPKAANSAAMDALRLQVYISQDPTGYLRAFTLPLARPERPAGQSVELETQTLVSADRPIYTTVDGFLHALLLGQGNLAPFIAAGCTLTAMQPPRFTTLAIESMQASTEIATAQDVPPKASDVEINVRATLQTASGVLMPMDFPLVMSVAAGHWQVDRINDAPHISITETDSAPTPTTPAQPAPTYAPITSAEGN